MIKMLMEMTRKTSRMKKTTKAKLWEAMNCSKKTKNLSMKTVVNTIIKIAIKIAKKLKKTENKLLDKQMKVKFKSLLTNL